LKKIIKKSRFIKIESKIFIYKKIGKDDNIDIKKQNKVFLIENISDKSVRQNHISHKKSFFIFIMLFKNEPSMKETLKNFHISFIFNRERKGII